MAINKKKMLKCPDCGNVLNNAYAEANYGRVLLLDQCPFCGGTWFDKWELYFLKDGTIQQAEAATVSPSSDEPEASDSSALIGHSPPPGLNAMDVAAFLAEKAGRKGSGQCPVCSVELIDFKDPLLPEDASIMRCPRCSGLWLNRGGLKRYMEHRALVKGCSEREVKGAAGPERGGEAIQSRETELSTLKRLQKELDASSLTARETPRALYLDEPPIDSKAFARDVGFLVLQALLRLVFKI